ncbi:MAG TPA: ATP-binding protein [Candidatus Paceibacterota bacterium]|nr:ATP-binding protein [Candidatus Paceibacterota bacterium]
MDERVKELSCLKEIARLAVQPNASLDAVLQQIVMFLPRAWQYPRIAFARIHLDGRSYTTPGFRESPWRLQTAITITGSSRGTVEMCYRRKTPALGKDPFLKEERDLIEAVARQLALVIEQKQVEEDKSTLRLQLLHADRLACIGMLAAGVAHELNEPVGNILGFVQLVQKCPGLPQSARRDLKKIEESSLQARDIIRNLLVFARQTTPAIMRVDLNRIIEDGLLFLEARCAKQGVDLIRRLSPGLPEIMADPAQVNQVVVNLVLNALQSMDGSGRITLLTQSLGKMIALVVEDTGCGMAKSTLDKIFIPFFTTKDVGQGTGLGLPVVHGIVTSHGGTIQVESKVGEGTRFEIRVPVAEPLTPKKKP